MDPFVALLDTLVNLIMLLGIGFAAGFARPHKWRKASFVLGMFWGLLPALVSKVTIPVVQPLLLFLADGGLFQALNWPGNVWLFYLVAWPLLALAVAAFGSFVGARLRSITRHRERGYE